MRKLSTLLLALVLVSCAHQSGQDHLTMATLWTQKAGEAKALSYQAFNIAKIELKKQLRRKNKKPLAKQVYPVPKKIDNQIAKEKLAAMGTKIDRLTPEQKKYLASWDIGT